MNYYLGIDGGGTKTKLCLMNSDNEVIQMAEGGPSSIDTVSEETTFNNFLNPFMEIINNCSNNITIKGVFAGIGGIVSGEDEKLVESIVRRLPNITKDTKIKAKNDMHNALASGLLFDEGVTLIVGTGSVAFGKDKHNHYHKCGGWGYKEGDLGSAYDIGFKAIKTMIKSYDGRIDITDFTKEVKDKIGIEKIEDVVGALNNLWNNRTEIASYAKLVTKHANLGDKYAKMIVDEATDQLALAVNGVIKNLNIDNKVIVIVGSLGNSEGYFKEQLHHKISLIDKDIKIISPLVDPALGAALMAKNL